MSTIALQIKRGRRPRPIDLAQVTALASRNLSNAEIAVSLGVGTRTFYTRLASDEDLRAALDAGRQRFGRIVENAFYARIAAGEWKAIRLLMLRNLGWLDGGFFTRGNGPALQVLRKVSDGF